MSLLCKEKPTLTANVNHLTFRFGKSESTLTFNEINDFNRNECFLRV